MRADRILSSCIVMTSLLLAGEAMAHGDNELPLYVAPGGTDSGDCIDADSPCSSIGYALTRAGKGGRILVAEGRYDIASAEDDRWADPRGEFLSGFYADPVYRLLGTTGIGAAKMPEVDQPVMNPIGYHVRSGGHDVTDFDWKAYLDFADKHLGEK